MKVLWLCNLTVPQAARALGISGIPKEGWVEGLMSAIAASGRDIELAVAFPVSEELDGKKGSFKISEDSDFSVSYFAFFEDTVRPDIYDAALEDKMKIILDEFKPDVVHSFGTEYPHTLAMAKVLDDPGRLLISIQGPISIYATKYLAHLPESVVSSATFRDLVKKDSIPVQQEKYTKRGENEISAVRLAGHLAGRTGFDKKFCEDTNPEAVYHHAGETLRASFYEHTGEWSAAKAKPLQIFVSQADYPIKGFHYLLRAVGELKKEDPSKYGGIRIRAAGQSVVGYSTLREKIKISAYGKYLRKLILQGDLEENVGILGRLGPDRMIEEYLNCSVYVCASEIENSPNSLGEAMLLGVPCIAANVGGISTIFHAPEEGWTYENRDEDTAEEIVAGLKNALKEVFDDPSEGEARGKRASEHAKRNHSPENNVNELLEIYKDICG